MGWIERDHASTGTLIDEVARDLHRACDDAIRERGAAWLALAGGRTPLPIYAQLAAAEFNGTITAIPTDERCVTHEHPACNLRALREAFAQSHVVHAAAITHEDGDEAASLQQAHSLLAVNPQPFDYVLLGMGTDGHIASLFPGAANITEGLAMDSQLAAIATRPDPLPPEAPFARISLTLPRLLNAREIHLVVTGEDKRRVLRHAQQHDSSLPVAALLHARDHRVQIHWSP